MIIKTGLEKAFSSELHLEHRSEGDFVIKKVSKKERNNELLFLQQLSEAGIPALQGHEEGDNLVLKYIDNAQTLGDVETVENYRLFGATVRRIHDIRFDYPFFIDVQRERKSVIWADFIKQCLEEGFVKQKRESGLDGQTNKKIMERINSSNILKTDESSLLHCDLHANNALLKDGQMFIFDKGDQVFSGDPMYDLALITINLPGALYEAGENIDLDKKLLEAFIEGYGVDFTLDKQKLNNYVLLRSFERWPNVFELEIPKIIERILTN